MSIRRLLSTIGLAAVFGLLMPTREARGCCLTDWLFGRQSAPVAGLSFDPNGQVVVASPPMVQGGFPGTVRSYSLPLGGVSAPSLPLNNPNVYTGLPTSFGSVSGGSMPIPVGGVSPSGNALPFVTTNRVPLATTNRVPLSGRFRGLQTTGNPFYGTGNQYPTQFPSTVTSGNVAAAGGFQSFGMVQPAAAVGGQTVPVYPVAPPQPRGGLSRFFGTSMGTDVQTSYFSAPITYYRPVTSVDPVTGTTVTVQQPCTSTVQQVRRTPIRRLFGGPAAVADTITVCPPASGLGSTTTIAPMMGGGSMTTFPPATVPSPMPAAPQGDVFGGGLGSPSDQAPVPQPRLESARPTFSQPSPTFESAPEGNGSYAPRDGDRDGAGGFGGFGGDFPDEGYRDDRSQDSGDQGGFLRGDGYGGDGYGGDGYGGDGYGADGYGGDVTRQGTRPRVTGLRPAKPIPAPDDDYRSDGDGSSGWADSREPARSPGLPVTSPREMESRSSTPPRVREASLYRPVRMPSDGGPANGGGEPAGRIISAPASPAGPPSARDAVPTAPPPTSSPRESGWYSPQR